jgi:hypothetical protein
MRKYTPEDIYRIACKLGKPKKYNSGYTCLCPVHEDRNPRLSIFQSDKYPIGVHCFAGCPPKDIVERIKGRGLFLHNRPSRNMLCLVQKLGDVIQERILPKNAPGGSDAYKKNYASKLWKEAREPAGTLVETYLKARGIHGAIPPSIRFLPSYKHTETGTHWPCMIANVTRYPDKKASGVHLTYLLEDGSNKAHIKPDKRMLGLIAGGAARLTPTTEILIVGEGIETTLSVMDFLKDSKEGYSFWSVLSASNFDSLILPELPLASTIIIAADHDEDGKGLRVAKAVAKKWELEGRHVSIIITTKKGTDFNDALRESWNEH